MFGWNWEIQLKKKRNHTILITYKVLRSCSRSIRAALIGNCKVSLRKTSFAQTTLSYQGANSCNPLPDHLKFARDQIHKQQHCSLVGLLAVLYLTQFSFNKIVWIFHFHKSPSVIIADQWLQISVCYEHSDACIQQLPSLSMYFVPVPIK